MLKKTSLSLLRELLNTSEANIERIVALLEMNKKQFWYELSILNEELVDNQLPPIHLENGRVRIDEDDRRGMKKFIADQTIDLYQYQEERIYFLYLYFATKEEFLSNIHLQEFLQLSRNAVMLDLKRLRAWTEEHNVFVRYDRSEGYILIGDEREIRKLMEIALSKLKKQFSLGEVLLIYQREWNKPINVERINQYLIKISQQHHISMVHDRMEEFVYLIVFVKYRMDKQVLHFSKEEKKVLKDQELYKVSTQLVRDVLKENDECEMYFWTSRLLGIAQGEASFANQSYFTHLTESILMNASTMVGLEYSQLESLKETLYQHIVPAYFRIMFDVYYENPLLEKIKKEYSELFEVTRRALQPLEKEVGHRISESEIAYFTIHFGGYLKRTEDKEPITAAVVCPNGISSSLIMASTIRETFPELKIIRVHSIEDVKAFLTEDVEMVFSTMYFSTDKPIYVTNPILNPVEREVLREQVQSDFPRLPKTHPVSTSDIVKIIERHGVIHDKQGLANELQYYLYQTNRVEEKGMKNLPDILNESLIRVTEERTDWKGAIVKAAQPLLEQEYIESDYIDAMIETVENIGPYIVLAPKVAVPHARPERGVKKLGISLLKLSHPVDFNTEGEEDPERYVQLVFVLAAVDGEAHLKALMQLSKILEDEEHIEALIKLNEPTELYKKIQYLVENEGGV